MATNVLQSPPILVLSKPTKAKTIREPRKLHRCKPQGNREYDDACQSWALPSLKRAFADDGMSSALFEAAEGFDTARKRARSQRAEVFEMSSCYSHPTTIPAPSSPLRLELVDIAHSHLQWDGDDPFETELPLGTLEQDAGAVIPPCSMEQTVSQILSLSESLRNNNGDGWTIDRIQECCLSLLPSQHMHRS